MASGSSARPVLIAGGGIGGLATALGLAQKGIRSILLEKAAALGEIGAGIQLGPNAFHAFDYLGVGEAARGMAVYVDQMRLMDALTAEQICHVDLRKAFRARFGNPYAVVHRGDLHGVLLKACRDHNLIELRTSADVTGYRQDGNVVAAKLANGETVRGAALIGADGLWSSVRRQVTGDGPPRVSGHTTYRSVIPTEQMPEDLYQFTSPEEVDYTYKLDGRKTLCNVGSVGQPRGGDWRARYLKLDGDTSRKVKEGRQQSWLACYETDHFGSCGRTPDSGVGVQED